MEDFNNDRYVFSNSRSRVDNSEETIEKRQNQISLMIKEIYLYRVLIKDLIVHSPNLKDKNQLINISYYIVNNGELLEKFQSKREIPFKRVSRDIGISVTFLERWRGYIITYCILISNPNYNLILEYLKIEYVENYKEILLKEVSNDNLTYGMLLKINKRSSFILTSNGEFLSVKNIPDSVVGSEIKSKEKTRLKHIKLKIAILLILLLSIGIGIYNDYTTPVRTIIIESTSKIKLETNRYNNIIYVYAPTEKGKAMLKYAHAINKNYDESVKKCIEYANDNKMIPESGLVITISGSPIKFGSLEKTGDYIVEKNIHLLVNNAGNQQKLYETIIRQKEEKNEKR